MSEDNWQYLVEIDERLLMGGAVISERATALVQDSDKAFVAGANLARVITCMAAIETHLRGEGGAIASASWN